MIGNTGTILSFERVRRIAAVAAILAASCLAIGGDDPQKKGGFPKGALRSLARVIISRMPNFFYFDYQFDPLPGKRLWLRVDAKHWVERYPDGMETRFRVLGRTRRGGRPGVGRSRSGSPAIPEEDDNFQVFIPDKGDEPMRFLFRAVEDGKGEWAFLAEIKKVE